MEKMLFIRMFLLFLQSSPQKKKKPSNQKDGVGIFKAVQSLTRGTYAPVSLHRPDFSVMVKRSF